MSQWSAARRATIIVAAVFFFSVPAQAQQAAQSLANRFAGETEHAHAKKKSSARKIEQGRRTAAARARAKAAQAAQLARYVEEVRKAEEADMLDRARREAEDMRAAERNRLIQEAEQARAQAEARSSDEAMAASTPPAPPIEKATEQPATAAVQAPIAITTGDAQATKQERLAEQRAAESQHLLAKLRRASRLRDARLAAAGRREETAREEATNVTAEVDAAPVVTQAPPPPSAGEPHPAPQHTEAAAGTGPVQPPSASAASQPPNLPTAPPPTIAAAPGTSTGSAALGPPEDDDDNAGASRPTGPPPRATPALAERIVTVLLVMAPGHRGIRRHNKSADPVLCVAYGCYVSAGPAWPARFMPGHRALGIVNTWGLRAGACRNSLGCVFRGIEVVDLPGFIQPVDLRVIRHDRREPQMITGDSACQLWRGRLVCNRGIYAEDYAMWIVPESIAAAAGPEALLRAVSEGLEPRFAQLAPDR
ncbi:MAG TPA: hypothetical protein VG900_10465 [Hyphomicrobiaceae bacterium]|nr:hypothetical protein [Hyphomicrobiaceae bacterium]